MPNPIVFFEIGCKDIEANADFYSKLFTWDLLGSGPNRQIHPGEGIPGQLNSLGHEPHQYTIFYVQVDDVAASVEQAKSLGGSLLVGPMDIPIGTFAWIADPGGNTVGLWKPKA